MESMGEPMTKNWIAHVHFITLFNLQNWLSREEKHEKERRYDLVKMSGMGKYYKNKDINRTNLLLPNYLLNISEYSKN